MTKASNQASRPATKQGAAPDSTHPEHDDSPAVNALVAGMTHPLKKTLEAVRRTILASETGITEGVKWNSPSFYCHGWFATISSRKPTQLDVVFYCGAKVRANCTVRDVIDDRDGLLTWPSKDRALLSFKSDAEFRTRLDRFQDIVRKWAGYQKSYAKNA